VETIALRSWPSFLKGDGHVDFSEVLSAANALSVDDRIRLMDAIWDGIDTNGPIPELTEAQKQELDRRLAEDDASPEDVIAWEDINAEIKARLGE
jgi:putative addiction module component (TIGR02574 family)